jgi:hypothetical protein
MTMMHETTMDGAIRSIVLGLLAERARHRTVNAYELARAAAEFFPGIAGAALAQIAAEEAIACGVCVLWERAGANGSWLTIA